MGEVCRLCKHCKIEYYICNIDKERKDPEDTCEHFKSFSGFRAFTLPFIIIILLAIVSCVVLWILFPDKIILILSPIIVGAIWVIFIFLR
ncbi:MAG: hypothetical protein ACFE94_05135 [Candidatus Hodarchaeota archaeon]